MDWKRVVAFVILLAACMVFAFIVSVSYINSTTGENVDVPLWWTGQQFSGKLTAFAPDQITLKDDIGNTKTFMIDANTKIAFRGAMGFTEGMPLKVVYRGAEEKPIAKSIRLLKETAAGQEAVGQPVPSPSQTGAVEEVQVESETVEVVAPDESKGAVQEAAPKAGENTVPEEVQTQEQVDQNAEKPENSNVEGEKESR
ncbi:MAG: hypothetical protein M1269_06510 [Chloroflexi bacterium]|nr:hypothetical protein [Chloroflexota bacterium]